MGRGRKPKNAGVVAADIETVEMKEGVVANPEEMPVADESSTGTSTKKKTAADKEAGKVKKQTKAKAENNAEKKSTRKPYERKSKAVKTDEEAEASALPSEKKERKSKKSETSVKTAKTKEKTSKKKTNDDKEVNDKATKTKTVKDKISKKVNEKVIIQMPGSEQDTASIIERAVDQWVAGGHKKSEINSITLYVKPEEKKAYCVINVYDSVEIGL